MQSLILSLQTTRTVANDYTVRFDNAVYQQLPPAWPGLRGGKVLLEQRANGTLQIRFRQRYLPFKRVQNGPAKYGHENRAAEKQSGAPVASLGGSARAPPPKPLGV